MQQNTKNTKYVFVLFVVQCNGMALTCYTLFLIFWYVRQKKVRHPWPRL